MDIKIAPSILSADFGRLNTELAQVESAGADFIHIDVMDGHFVPNITIGPIVVEGIRKYTKLPLDVHLMIETPRKFIDSFIQAGSDMITMHIESIDASDFGIEALRLKKAGVRTGISLNPATDLEKIRPVINVVDFVLVMSVNPGFGGQEFIPDAVGKISKLRAIFDGDIAVDGGINEDNAKLVVKEGANILVAGSYIFKSKNYTDAVRRLKCAKQNPI